MKKQERSVFVFLFFCFFIDFAYHHDAQYFELERQVGVVYAANLVYDGR